MINFNILKKKIKIQKIKINTNHRTMAIINNIYTITKIRIQKIRVNNNIKTSWRMIYMIKQIRNKMNNINKIYKKIILKILIKKKMEKTTIKKSKKMMIKMIIKIPKKKIANLVLLKKSELKIIIMNMMKLLLEVEVIKKLLNR